MDKEFFDKFEVIWQALWNWIYKVLYKFYPDDTVVKPEGVE